MHLDVQAYVAINNACLVFAAPTEMLGHFSTQNLFSRTELASAHMQDAGHSLRR